LISVAVQLQGGWEAWWRRAQLKLEDDERFDATRSRDRMYALATGISAIGRPLLPALRDEHRRGRRMADGPQLKRARERAQQRGPWDENDEALFRRELSIAHETTADPTDRFMSAELGIWLERTTEAEARGRIGDDAYQVDLVRIPGHASRTLALDWAFAGTPQGDAITLRSAMAVGPPWSARVLDALAQSPSALRQATFGYLGWSVPGDEDAGPAKLKDDIPTFERRVALVTEAAGGFSPEARLGVWDGGLHALASFPKSSVHAAAVERLKASVAYVCWAIYAGLEPGMRPPLKSMPPMSGDAYAPLVRAAPAAAQKELRAAVVRWYGDDPAGQFSNLRLTADLLGENALRLGLEAAGRVTSQTNLPRIALQLMNSLDTTSIADEASAAVVNLAVTAVPDDPTVASALDRLAEAVAEGYVRGTARIPGPITFSRSGWERFSAVVAQQLEDSAAAERRAVDEASAAKAEADESRTLAEQRARALTESRGTASSEVRQDAGRLAANLLRPVALAVADSFEAQSLESLQDRLLAVLQRARISAIHEVGDVAPFDPTRHQWVGEGSPTENVQAKSPGFVIAGEGNDQVVLVPARVVAAAGA
jgi:hypothetical protein